VGVGSTQGWAALLATPEGFASVAYMPVADQSYLHHREYAQPLPPAHHSCI